MDIVLQYDGLNRLTNIVDVTDYRPSSCSAEKSVIGWPVDSATKENQAATWREDWRAFCQLCGVSWATCWFVVVGRRSKTSLR